MALCARRSSSPSRSPSPQPQKQSADKKKPAAAPAAGDGDVEMRDARRGKENGESSKAKPKVSVLSSAFLLAIWQEPGGGGTECVLASHNRMSIHTMHTIVSGQGCALRNCVHECLFHMMVGVFCLFSHYAGLQGTQA